MNYNRNLVFTASCIVIFIFGISLITLGATLPQLSDEYGLTEINKGTLASMLPLGILIGSLYFGPIVDKYSYKLFLPVNVILIILGFLLISISSSFIHLAIAFLVIGTGGGALNGSSSSLVSDFSADFNEHTGSNLSLMGVFFGLGALGMPLLLSLLSSHFDYKMIVRATGVAMILPVIFLLAIRYPSPKQSSAISIKQLGQIARDGLMILLSMVLFFQSGWESLLNNWVTTYLIETKSIAESSALQQLTWFITVFTLGRIVVGVLLKRYSGTIILSASSVLALLGCILLSMSTAKMWIISGLTLAGFGLAAAFPVVLGMIGHRFSKWSGTAFGMALTIALLGNMFINYITGLVTDANGISTYALMLIAAGIGTTGLILFTSLKFKNL